MYDLYPDNKFYGLGFGTDYGQGEEELVAAAEDEHRRVAEVGPAAYPCVPNVHQHPALKLATAAAVEQLGA